MNLATRAMGLMERRARGDISLGNLDAFMDALVAGMPSATGMTVTPERALYLAPVYAAVSVLAEAVASCACVTYKVGDGGERTEAPGHSLYDVLRWAPNPEMTAFEFWEMAMGHALLWGNFYAEIERNAYGIKALWPLRPDRMRIVRDSDDELVYLYTMPGQQAPRPFSFLEVFTIRGKAVLEAVRGTSAIDYGREAIGLAMSAERFGAKFFGNDSRPGGVLQYAGKLSKEAKERLKESWEQSHGGSENRWRIAVLEDGVTWQTIGVPPEQAQFLETRKFQRSEIAALFRVPPHMIGDLEHATFSNIEHQGIQFVTNSIEPWTTRIEQAMRRDLFRIAPGMRSHRAEFDTDPLKYGDFLTRQNALAIARQNGVITANDWRRELNLNPHPDGNVLLVNGNMIPISQANEPPKPAPPPPLALPVAAPSDDEGDDDEPSDDDLA